LCKNYKYEIHKLITLFST